MASISTRWPWSWPRSACGSMPSRSARRLTLSTKAKKRVHKGHPLCNLAIVARAIGSPTLTHHYAMLSSAGDIYWKHQEPHLQHGGYAPTMLEQFESHQQQRAWREKIENDLKSIPTDKPWYLESFLAARWFSEPYAQHFMNRAGWKSTEAGHSLKCCSIPSSILAARPTQPLVLASRPQPASWYPLRLVLRSILLARLPRSKWIWW